MVYGEYLLDTIYKYIYDCIWSIISLCGWPDFKHDLCIVGNESQYLDWTIYYLSTKRTFIRVSALYVFHHNPEKVRYKVIGVEMKGMERSMKLVALGATQRKG